MLIKLPTGSTDPLYVQVASAIRRAIADGDLAAGDVLPTARDLAAALGVNMHTVLRAYATLRDEGLLELRRRRGTVVTDHRPVDRAQLADLSRRLVVESKRFGLTRSEIIKLVDQAARSLP